MSIVISKRIKYVKEYYTHNYSGGFIDPEIKVVSSFLIKNVKGKVLDCGCGPVPQIWSIFMPKMTELYAIDLPIESIEFVNEKLKTFNEWENEFKSYVKLVQDKIPTLPNSYLKNKINKIISVQQADMTKILPFEDNTFDTVISLYSLGVLSNLDELERAIANITNKLKPRGVLLHINTDGHNKNDILPEYTWRGLDQTCNEIKSLLVKYGFDKIKITKKKINRLKGDKMYRYNSITLLRALKK
jgi:SAM-dependent methyltransferase